VITCSEKKRLRSLAQCLEPHIRIGKSGLTPGVLESINNQLSHHELVKIRFEQHKDEKHSLLAEITQLCGCELMQVLGHVAVLYKKRSPAQ
jgi:RNA-binding protein